jgi:tRNA nucleotidyltransferase (CCA-adding enzyme)
MKKYLVGGAVRDERLGLPVTDHDWCVTGATPDALISLGFKPVGKGFPVFIHPDSGEEYALARTERKTGSGYHGFHFHADPDVSIEDDLGRRDLTINAMAVGEDGVLTDPFGGAADLEARVLRHVSEAFVEDPVRILRVAKFAARFSGLGFRIADETMDLMSRMVDSGEADALVADRVWKETEAALGADNPQVFFDMLRRCGALRRLYPELDLLFGVPQPKKWHPEIDCGLHTMMVLEQAAILSPDGDVRFAALVHDLGKATTDRNLLPAHHGHEQRSVKLVRKLSTRLPVPNAYRDLALLVAEFHGHSHRAFELKAATLLRVLQRTDAFRRPARFEKFVVACEADARGRTGLENAPYPQADFLRAALQATSRISAADIAEDGLGGAEIGQALKDARIRALNAFKSDHQPPKK